MSSRDMLRFWIGIRLFVFRDELRIRSSIARIDRSFLVKFCAATDISEKQLCEAILVCFEDFCSSRHLDISKQSKEILGRIIMTMSRIAIFQGKYDVVSWMISPRSELLGQTPINVCAFRDSVDFLTELHKKARS